jgi:hypothetical protein
MHFPCQTPWLFPFFKFQKKDFMAKYSGERLSITEFLGNLKFFGTFHLSIIGELVGHSQKFQPQEVVVNIPHITYPHSTFHITTYQHITYHIQHFTYHIPQTNISHFTYQHTTFHVPTYHIPHSTFHIPTYHIPHTNIPHSTY